MNSLQIRWRHLLALSLILLCSVSALFARPLNEREARHLAEQFFHQVAYTHKVLAPAQQPLSLVSAPIRQSAGVELRTLSGDKARYYYIYNRGSNAGFVIIAGDDELTPYIGYSTTGRFIVEDMPEQLAAFLKACQERIDELVSSISYHQALQPTRPSATEPTHIDPLLGNIQWNQSAPWNDQTPVVGGEHTPVGCVATAYTQVMRYHQWPTQGEGIFSYKEERSDRQHSVDYGSTTYDWANMPERYDDPSRATEEETKALSTLAYHAGVAVEMMYAPSGSGSYTPLVARALADHFRYDKRVSFKSRANYTQATWEQLLRNELIAARPIVYSGSGSGGGHAFVCDGYDAEGLFHINWGWGGMSDGYFNLNYLVPSDLGIGGGAGGGFSLGQGAVIGIKPDRTGTSQRTVSSVVTTWRFSMRFDEGTLDATADYEVYLADDATLYDDLITYGVTRLGSADTIYLDQYARNAHLGGLYQSISIEGQKLQLSNYINEGTWDFFLAYRAKKDATGDTVWRPCGQHERAKDQYRRTFTISRESDGSYTVTEDASSNQPKLELVAGSVQSNIVGYEKSQVSLQLRNTGRFEYFNQLYLFARKAGENQFQPLLNILPAIEAGGQKRVTFDIDRFPYGSGDVELEMGYFVGGRFTSVWSNTVSIQPATEVRTAYTLSSDQPVTANLSTGAFSQIRIRNVGTMDPHFPDRAFFIYRWELSKGDKKTATRWSQTDFIHAGDEVSFTPNLKDELRDIDAKVGDVITLSATFVVLYEENGKSKLYSYITMLEQGSLAVTCTKDLIVGNGVITMTTAKPVGESIKLYYEADGDVSIEGANGTPRPSDFVDYKLNNQQVTLRGDITALYCMENRLTDIDVSQCRSLRVLLCLLNEIKGESMLQLVNSLPDRTGLENGLFVVYSDGSYGSDGNVCLNSDVAIARAKNWEVALATVENGKLKLYRYDGEDPTKTFAVTLTKKGEGTLTATGADDLNAVPYGTELTIEATPAEGYELFALTANGKDILATKKLSVREDTEIKATFAKVGDGVITMTTSRAVGEQIMLAMSPVEGQTVIAEGLKEPLILDGTEHLYTLTSQTVTLLGNLTFLKCNGNLSRPPVPYQNLLTSLDVSGCNTLTKLDCSKNSLQSLDVSGCNTLSELYCSDNSLQSLDITHNEALTKLSCWGNQLETLDLSQCLNLVNVDLSWNQLTHLDVSHNGELQFLECVDNQIKGEAMTALVNGLPDRMDKEPGRFKVIREDAKTDGNICLKSDVAIAKAKNWSVEDENGDLYEGEDDSQPSVGDGVITMTTSRAVGEQIMLAVSPVEGQTVIAEGLKESLILDGKGHLYTLTSQTVTLRGNLTLLLCDGAVDMETPPSHENQLTSLDINCETLTLLSCSGNPLTSLDLSHARALTTLVCYENKLTQLDLSSCTKLTGLGVGDNLLTHLDVSHNSELQFLECFGNQIKGEAMTELVNGLPNRMGKEPGMFKVIGQDAKTDGNICLKSDVAIAKGKNWSVQSFSGDYEGEDPTYSVTLTKEGEGTLTVTGADDLDAVPYDTELTVIATPAEGYELTALTANGTDILATKKFVVKGATEVKATFTKKTFAVTFTQEGEGKLTATGANNLNAVPYGTKLTVEAAPAEGYELTALTANGTDILATKKIVVKDNLTVKATFTKKTFAVTFAKEGEGALTATGADDLNAVPYGTELTVEAAPAKGYELTALTANGEDILSSKQFTVQGATEVKATFTKKTFAVTFAKEGEGTITATGADDLNAVLYGTELTIKATPAEGYELTALTANGKDILSTKQFTVQRATEVKATFTKKTYPVTLTPNEHGTISIVEPVNLEAVAYGTTLTVKASGKNAQCELTALTANGKDILSTKQFIVKEATEVKATFVDHTGVETIGEQTVRIYPNPAQTFVLIEGLQPASQVSLYSMTGEQLYTGQTDRRGTLRIDLTALSDGVYLLVGEGWQKRLVVKK